MENFERDIAPRRVEGAGSEGEGTSGGSFALAGQQIVHRECTGNAESSGWRMVISGYNVHEGRINFTGGFI